ncbi:hypothetical protein GGS23DRAFT_204165 [Durotheca rogersii]|uniref:uncharacterized protein n=1 Tax=Durotheca rogersii TaxID=419775 RepID=UPI002220E00B|nr:uncharacterized protein GGS23DRAFT_204165 [Durotheca rogersii]KAI5860989.1 hypothetical protein GGS23DRAFT_204165 [Durotheca rogersii]
MSDANRIAHCKSLVDYIHSLFGDGREQWLAETTPGKAMEYYPVLTVALYGQHLGEGSLYVNMRSPALIRFLKRLAENGVGEAEEYGNVKWKFMPIESIP